MGLVDAPDIGGGSVFLFGGISTRVGSSRVGNGNVAVGRAFGNKQGGESGENEGTIEGIPEGTIPRNMEARVHGCMEGTQAGWKGDKGARDL